MLRRGGGGGLIFMVLPTKVGEEIRVRHFSTAQLSGSTDFFVFIFWAAELHRQNNIDIILDADSYNCVRFRRSEGRTHCSMIMLRAVGSARGGVRVRQFSTAQLGGSTEFL